MNDWTFYLTAAGIGLVGAMASQVLTLQQSFQLRDQTRNLEKKQDYCRLVMNKLDDERKEFQDRMWKLEEEIAKAKNTADDKTEEQYRDAYSKAEQQRRQLENLIAEWDQQRNEVINTISSVQKTYFLTPWFLFVLNIVVGVLVSWLFGFIEVITRGPGNATLTINLIIEFLFAGAFWPLIWQRLFNTATVQEHLTAAVAKFDVSKTPSSASAERNTTTDTTSAK